MELDDECQWLQLQADDYSAWVSIQTLQKHPDSLLAGLADTAVAHGRDSLRLCMNADVAREVVSVLRLGDGYAPPADSRLVSALQHQLDYLGLPSPPRLPPRLPHSSQYLFVHNYSCDSVDSLGKDMGLLLYSAAGGWSALEGEGRDPRPANMDPEYFYSTATLSSSVTGENQDLMLVAGPECVGSYIMEADTRKCHAVPSVKGTVGPCLAVNGKAYMLGRHSSAAVSCYDPSVNVWFTAAPMHHCMYDFTAVSPPGSSIVLTFGGVDSSTGRHRDGIDLYDTRARSWSPGPSNAVLPRASRGLSAATLDEHRVLVFGGSAGCAAYILELRTWQLQAAGQLSEVRQHAAGVSYDGSVLAMGGVDDHEEYVDLVEMYDQQSNSWRVVGHTPCPMGHMAVAAANVKTTVSFGLRQPAAEPTCA